MRWATCNDEKTRGSVGGSLWGGLYTLTFPSSRSAQQNEHQCWERRKLRKRSLRGEIERKVTTIMQWTLASSLLFSFTSTSACYAGAHAAKLPTERTPGHSSLFLTDSLNISTPQNIEPFCFSVLWSLRTISLTHTQFTRKDSRKKMLA